MSRIVIHPQDPNIVYVGALGHAHGPQQARGVFNRRRLASNLSPLIPDR